MRLRRGFWRTRAVLAASVVVLASACGGGDGITVTGGAVAGLRFTVHPSTSAAGTVFSVTVELTTSNGQRAATATNVIQLSISGGATLSGGTSKAAVAGVATFDGLAVTRAGSGYQLTASAAGFTAASNAFAISPATVSAAQSTVVLNPATLNAGTPATATFTFKDAHGNLIAGAPVVVTSNLGGATFTPPSGTTDAEGRFATTFLATVAGNAILTITVAGSEFAFATPFIVGGGGNACTPTPIAFPGAVNGAISNASCTNNTPATTPAGLATALYSFTLNATTAARFSVTSTFGVPQVEVMSNPPGNNLTVSDATNSGSVVAEWMLPAGSYIARVSSQTGANGTFALGGSSAALGGTPGTNGTCYIRMLVVGVTLNQTLSATDCPWDNPPDGTFADIFAIRSLKACTITMSSPTMTPWLEVRDLAGNVLDATFGSGAPSTAVMNRGACSNGGTAILIYTNSVGGSNFGDYTLTLTITGGGSDAPASGLGAGLVEDLHGILPPTAPTGALRKPTWGALRQR